MGVKVTRGGSLTQTMNRFTAGIAGRLESQSKVVAIRAGIEGQQAMQEVIRTTPSDINPSKMDRIDTGYMINSVKHSTTFRHRRFTSKFGWLSSHKAYFTVQDTGGTAFGKYQITGMFALRAGMRAAEAVIIRDMQKVVKK